MNRAAESSIPLTTVAVGCHQTRITGQFKQVLECHHAQLKARFDNLKVVLPVASTSNCENRTEMYQDVHFFLPEYY